jgi:hypothetical protein
MSLGGGVRAHIPGRIRNRNCLTNSDRLVEANSTGYRTLCEVKVQSVMLSHAIGLSAANHDVVSFVLETDVAAAHPETVVLVNDLAAPCREDRVSIASKVPGVLRDTSRLVAHCSVITLGNRVRSPDCPWEVVVGQRIGVHITRRVAEKTERARCHDNDGDPPPAPGPSYSIHSCKELTICWKSVWTVAA